MTKNLISNSESRIAYSCHAKSQKAYLTNALLGIYKLLISQLVPETLVVIVKYAEKCSVSIDAVPVDLHTSHKQTKSSLLGNQTVPAGSVMLG